ncbi:MAG: glycosyltransferase family A protein [Desulfobulbaceae bacterium]
MRQDLISVIIPTHNRGPFLQQAVRSVCSQTLSPAELIVVDDGSTDDTRRLVAALAREAPFPVFYMYQDNRGAAAARNMGIRAARGGLICFLDSDDRFVPEKLARQAERMRGSSRRISHTGEIWYRRGVRLNQKRKHRPPHGDIFHASLRMCMVGMSTVMIRREIFDLHGCFDETLPCCEDYDYWLRVGAAERFLLVDEPLTVKNGGRPDQLSVMHRQGMDKYRIRALVKLLARTPLSPAQRAAALAELERKCTIYGRGCIKHGRPAEGRRYLDMAAMLTKGDDQSR